MKFLRQAVSVFFAMVILDLVFARYVVAAASMDALLAAWWAATIQVCNVFVVSAFVRDRRLAVPCVAGAFVGTFAAIHYF